MLGQQHGVTAAVNGAQQRARANAESLLVDHQGEAQATKSAMQRAHFEQALEGGELAGDSAFHIHYTQTMQLAVALDEVERTSLPVCSDVHGVRVTVEHEETFPRAKARRGIDIRP